MRKYSYVLFSVLACFTMNRTILESQFILCIFKSKNFKFQFQKRKCLKPLIDYCFCINLLYLINRVFYQTIILQQIVFGKLEIEVKGII